MTPFRTAVITCALSAVAFCPASFGQYISRETSLTPKKNFVKDRAPARRWILTFNPLGLMELPLALGAGIGYRLDKRWELWSETSLIRNGLAREISDVHGIRQTLQLKRFFNNRGQNFFLAAEIRYKSFNYRDTLSFYNPASGDTLMNTPFHAHQYFWGAALQAGARWKMSRSGRFQVEITAGMGIKNKVIDRDGIGSGYKQIDRAIDINVWDMMATPGITVYFPGSARIIYTIGKRIL